MTLRYGFAGGISQSVAVSHNEGVEGVIVIAVCESAFQLFGHIHIIFQLRYGVAEFKPLLGSEISRSKYVYFHFKAQYLVKLCFEHIHIVFVYDGFFVGIVDIQHHSVVIELYGLYRINKELFGCIGDRKIFLHKLENIGKRIHRF